MRIGTLATCAALIAGCLSSGSYTPIQRYAIYSEVDVEKAAPTSKTLGVRPLDYVRFYKEPMVYRGENFEISTYDYHRWAELPREAVTRMLIDALTQSERFRDVGYAYDMQRPDWVLTGELRRFDQVRTSEPWQAVCEARFELRERASGAIVWSGTIAADAPHESNDAAGFAAAMNEALTELVKSTVERIVSDDT